jgi:hypothetical protein
MPSYYSVAKVLLLLLLQGLKLQVEFDISGVELPGQSMR